MPMAIWACGMFRRSVRCSQSHQGNTTEKFELVSPYTWEWWMPCMRGVTGMEAEGGGDVQIRIDVMDVVEAPEPGHVMVGQVPIVKRQVQQQKPQGKLEGRGHIHDVQQAKRRL